MNAHIPLIYRVTALSLDSLLVSLYLALMGPLIGWIAESRRATRQQYLIEELGLSVQESRMDVDVDGLEL